MTQIQQPEALQPKPRRLYHRNLAGVTAVAQTTAAVVAQVQPNRENSHE